MCKRIGIESINYRDTVMGKPGKPKVLPKFDSQSSEKYTGISLRIQWKLSAEGNAFRKCQQIIAPLIIKNAIIFKGQN